MAKDSASKKLTTKKSTEGLKAKLAAKKAGEKAATPTPTTTKSLKRKQDVETTKEDSKAPSPKKGKVTVESVKSQKEEKSSKSALAPSTTTKGKAAAKPADSKPAATKDKAPAKSAPRPAPAKSKAKASAPAKPSNSKRKQPSPKPMAPSSDEEEEEEEEEEASSASEEEREAEAGEGPSDSEQDDGSEEEGEENVHLHGFSTDDEDSSDDEMEDGDARPFDVAKLPTVAKDDAIVKAKLEKAKKKPTEDRGVLYLGRIPHGFYEDQMKAYFSQFGDVTRLRISRNKKTGKSKHYGFIEFDSSSVAKIVAETMDNYLLNGHILQCKLIPKEEVHPELWIGANRKWRTVPPDQLTRARHNKKRDEETREAIAKRLVKRQNRRKRKLQELGISYDFDAVSYKKSKATEA
ncbi:RNA binding protein [Coprinopsis cinerea okayama7|uniref:RNA binding protein n=1 Tax=Coprinopsis cinerea (strain Okayama-7 / 130 / ATCC MYA-4618 / FGSC 9003) TaxID=240176 RepID=A8NTB3_COPC7|nr:RNA binding protein [Coprinopsis cinerea okayama7\|eukprot:XP_001836188.1 RNA binding protein [Coprinopsis cinerea okayama7\